MVQRFSDKRIELEDAVGGGLAIEPAPFLSSRIDGTDLKCLRFETHKSGSYFIADYDQVVALSEKINSWILENDPTLMASNMPLTP